MAATASAPMKTAGRTPWGVLGLMVLSSFLCLVDRTNLSVAATDIQRDLQLSPYQLGVLLSAFFATYASFQLLAISGWIVDRFHVAWVFAGGFLLWSAATGLTGMAGSFATIYALRLLLGAGESVAYPAYSRILVTYFPESRRGFANALIDASTKAGPAVGTLVGGLLMSRYGWRVFFFVLGFTSLLWLVPWMIWMPGKGVKQSREEARNIPSIVDILLQRSAWCLALGQFCSNYFWYFLITWLPAYLERQRHFSKDKMAVFGSFAFLLIALVSVTCGWLGDWLIARGNTPTRVRKSFAGTGMALATIILPVAYVQDERTAMILLFAACAAFGIYTPTLFAMTQTLAGPLAAGKWTGLQNGFANMAGIVAPIITGWVVGRTGEFHIAFILAAAVALAGAGFFTIGVGRLEPVTFRSTLRQKNA